MPRHADRPGSPLAEDFDVGGDSDMPGADQPVTLDDIDAVIHSPRGTVEERCAALRAILDDLEARHAMDRSSDLDELAERAREGLTVLDRPIPNKFDLHFKSNVSPEMGAQYWRPIVNLMLSLSNQLGPAFSRDRISSETVRKGVPNFVGVIGSLKEIHKPTFSEFASKVALAS